MKGDNLKMPKKANKLLRRLLYLTIICMLSLEINQIIIQSGLTIKKDATDI